VNQFLSLTRIALVSIALALLASCGGNGGTASPATLQSIQITPGSPSAAVGTTTPLIATGIYADNSHQDLTDEVKWTSASTAIGTINATGVVTAVSAGATTITAASQGVTASASFVVTSAVIVSIDITPPTPNLALGMSLQLVATGVFSDSSTQDLTSQVTWTAWNPAVATFSTASGSAGLLTAGGLGSSNISATFQGLSGSTILTVTPAVLASIEVAPSTPNVPNGASQQFTATGVFSDNTTQDLTSQVTWTSSSAGVATISQTTPSVGLLTTLQTGTTTVSATLASISGSASVTVTPAALASIEVTPSIPSVAKGLTGQFTATGVYTDNSTKDLTTTVTWASSTPAVATVSNATGSNGLASSVDIGTTTITAMLGTVSGNTTLTVTAATLVSIGVTPSIPSLASGLTQQFTATGIYTDNSTQTLTTTVTWASATPAVATISNATGSRGIATAAAIGPTTITATLGAVSGSTTLTVTPATLATIEVTPATPSVAKGLTQQFSATGIYTDNTTQNLTTTVTWSPGTPTVATISNAPGTRGLATTVSVGNTVITATLGGVSGNTTLTVAAATLVSIGVTPALPSIANGLTQQFTATGVYTDSSTQDLTTTVTWSPGTPATASISNAAGSHGLATSLNVGNTAITASLGGVSGNTTLTVTAATLVSIQVTPVNPALAKGVTQQFTATGTYTDHSTQNLTTTVTWSPSDPSVATISNAAGSHGIATAVDVGNATITATLGSVSGNTTLNVTIASLSSIEVTPANASIANGRTQQYAAMGTYSDGSMLDLTTAVMWGSAAHGVATISNNTGSQGLATSQGLGPTTISATMSGVTGSTGLTVTAAVLVSIAVTPADPSVAAGLTQQFVATGTYSDTTTSVITTSVTWTSSVTSAATISTTPGSKGLATGVASPGSTTITAASGSISGNTTLTVTPAVLVSIAVTPSGSFANGTTVLFTATGTFSDGTSMGVTASWATSNSKIVTVLSSGSATFAPGDTGVAVGDDFDTGATLTATVNSISGTTNVQMYESFTAGSGSASIFSWMQGSCTACHVSGSPATGAQGWYTGVASTTYSALSGFSDFPAVFADLCGGSDPSSPTALFPMPTQTAAQCQLIKAWVNEGELEN
jgi:trimeric autotransporter adhesin